MDYSHIIIRLIKADINNIKNVNVLSLFFTTASNHRLNLYEDIFELMQLNKDKNHNELKTWYFSQLNNAQYIPLNALDKVATDIYEGLKMWYDDKNQN